LETPEPLLVVKTFKGSYAPYSAAGGNATASLQSVPAGTGSASQCSQPDATSEFSGQLFWRPGLAGQGGQGVVTFIQLTPEPKGQPAGAHYLAAQDGTFSAGPQSIGGKWTDAGGNGGWYTLSCKLGGCTANK
jgi:hypothetical protein